MKVFIILLVLVLLFILFYKPREMYVVTNLLDVSHMKERDADIKKRITRKD